MRKLQKAAVIAAVVGGVAVLGAGPASAQDAKLTQANKCRSHDVNIGLLNNVGVANGALANLLGGEGDAGAQFYQQGSAVTCSNAIGGGS